METVNIGIIGVGHLGRFHALNYTEIPEANLVGIFDIDSERAKQVANECKCDSFKDLTNLLKSVDAVSIAVPTDHHFSTAKQAL